MTRSARRFAWAARPRAAAAAALATLLAAGSAALVTPAIAAATPVPAVTAGGTADDDAEAGRDDPADGTVRVVLDDVEPAVARVGETVTLRGRIVNDSLQRRRLTDVTVRSGWAPLSSRADVTRWLDGRDRREAGWWLGHDDVGPVVVPGAEVPFTVVLPDDALAALPGDLAALPIEVEATGEPEPGAGSAGATVPPLGPVVLRTVLTATRVDAVTSPLSTAWVVPLTLPPETALTGRDDRARHEAWLEATGPGSPARTWLENLTVPEVTWMVDPAMLVAVDPADGLAPDGPPAPGVDGDEETSDEEPAPTGDDIDAATAAPDDAGDQATAPPAPAGSDGATTTASPDEGADRGLEDGGELGGRPDSVGPATAEDVEEGLVALRGLLARTPSEQLWWTPRGDPDVAALLPLQDGLPRALEAMDLPPPEAPSAVEQLLRRGRSDVAWPALLAPTGEEVVALDRMWSTRPATPEGTAAVVMPRESLSGGSDTNVGAAAAPVQDAGPVVALGADTRVASLLAGAADDAAHLGEAAVTQRLLADSLTAYQQDPFAARSMVYAPPRGSAVPGGVLDGLTEGFTAAPWVQTVRAADLMSAASGTTPVPLSGAVPSAEVLGETLVARVQPAASPLDAENARAVIGLHATMLGVSQVLADDAAVATWEPMLTHLWSTRWRGQEEAWTQTWRDARRPVVRAQESVHVNPSTVNFLSDQGVMQVTVVNDLPVAVEEVRVEVVPASRLLRVVQQPEPISIGAGSRATVSFTARAVTRGTTTVSARLTAPNGTVLGDDAQVNVRVQPTGVWIYWVLGSIAGLVLILGLVRARRTAPRSAVVAASTPAQEES